MWSFTLYKLMHLSMLSSWGLGGSWGGGISRGFELRLVFLFKCPALGKSLWVKKVQIPHSRSIIVGQKSSMNDQKSVVSSCTGTQKKETVTNCVITPCMVMKTIGIPSCTGTPGQPPKVPTTGRLVKSNPPPMPGLPPPTA